MKILVAGCGYVGTALAQVLTGCGHQVWGLRRNASGLPPGIHPWAADLLRSDTLRDLPSVFDVIFYTAGAAAFDEASYRSAYVSGLTNLFEALRGAEQRPTRVFFTSSTGVYHQDAGEWLDESAPAAPTRFSGRVLLEAEALLKESGYRATVCRLGGIYGPGRTRLIEGVRSGQATCIDGRTHYLNLIHRDDAAGALAHLMTVPDPEPLYLIVDDEPVERCALLRWIAEQLGLPGPALVQGNESAEPQRGGNRRIRNTRLRHSGYSFHYPTYREGYAPLIAQ